MIDMNDPEVIESLKYLLIPKEEKIRLSALPFDAKKNCFVPHKTEGYVTAIIEKEEGDNVTVRTCEEGNQVTVKRDAVLQQNPMKYEKCDDMADLTYLNDATVYHNLRQRYINWYIYTYSGLFCVTINPFKRLPLYTMKMVHFYRGKKKNEVPPHLYLVADNAYAAMTRDRANQSMLITGESGAGKTENTKKVIQYFAFVAANVGKKKNVEEDPNKPSLEDQIVSANPVLEAYGNAKTTRNNNSSRFGKFIRIHFTTNFAIAGADIESYLLEKSRITYCMELERNYHIFYQLCSTALPELQKEIMLEPDAGKYFFINQGMLTIDKIDDVAEMKDTKKAFDILMFTQKQQIDLFKITSAVANWGNTKWKQRPREEQAEADGTGDLEIVAKLLGLDELDLIKGITKPRIKVGNEFVNKGQNKDQCTNSVGALSKAMFSRAFAWLVEVVNVTLDVKELKRAHFIGVLDIAGFETFEYNGFEQICINFTNERLQQFFNNFMFVLEQAEYKKEGIVWETMSFGADLQATIDLIEKKMGIFAILEEECIVPKATDMTFKEKLYKQHLGKHPSFGKPKPKKGSKFEAHFDLHHYAGVVSYSVDGWLEKNKDPINMTVAALFKNSKSNELLSYLFREIGEEEGKGGGGGKSKGGSQNTISSGHREQLNKLMKTLDATHPHFVRCIIPNEIKTGGVLDAHLVLHQLHCNGVLEGIRICRKGYPSRLIYVEFLARYGILAAESAKHKDPKTACINVLKDIKLDTESYRVGLSKVLFKAGVLGTLEEMRDEIIQRILTLLQSQMRRYLVKKNIKKMIEQKKALNVIQRNVKAFVSLRNWGWLKLYNSMKHLLVSAKKAEEERLRKEEEARLAAIKAEEERIANEKRAAMAKELEATNVKLLEEKNKLHTELSNLREVAGNSETMINKLNSQKNDMESNIKDLEEKISDEESKNSTLNSQKKKLEAELADSKMGNSDAHTKISKIESEVKSKENQIHKLQDEMAQQDESIAKLTKEKKRLEEANRVTMDSLQAEEDKNKNLNRIKAKLEQTLDETEDNLEREKKGRADLDKAKRKLEGELKSAQASIEETERVKKDVEEALKRKEQEAKSLADKVEEEHEHFASSQKKLSELQARLSEQEEETESERAGKVKAEKQRAELSRELDEMAEKLEESGGATSAQMDLNRKRESELAKLRSDLEAANVQHEASANQMRKKHQDAVNDMGEQIDQLQKAKNRLEKEKQGVKHEVDEAKAGIESANNAKSNVEKMVRQLEQQLEEINHKLDYANRETADVQSQKSRLQSENSNLLSQLEDSESQAGSFNRAKQQLNSQLEEARRTAEDEARARSSVVQQMRNLNSDLDSLKSQLDEEMSMRGEVQKQLAKAAAEAQQWKSKYESEGLGRTEELEEAKRKLSHKLQDAEEQVEQALIKCASLEKAKHRLQSDMEDLSVDVEKANSNASSLEKKQKHFDKLINEWKQKCEGITRELEESQKEARKYSAEVFKIKSQFEESQDSIEAIRRENKSLSEEIKDLTSQLNNDGRNVHELAKQKRKLEEEKEELHNALQEAEDMLASEESKTTMAQLELANIRQDIDRRLHEKEEEFDNTRRNHARALESMQASLDAESKGRSDLLRQKKKLEQEVNELEVGLDHSNRTIGDLQKSVKRMQDTVAEQQSAIEDEQRATAEARENAAAAERHTNAVLAESEEMRAAMESAERARKATEMDLHDAIEQISELSSAVANLNAQKRKLECDAVALQSDVDMSIAELRSAEENLRKGQADAARLVEEVRHETERAHNAEKLRKNLENHVKDLTDRLEQAELNSLKGGKRIIQKLEQKIQEVQADLDAEQRHHSDTINQVKKNDRRLKDLVVKSEEDKRSQLRLQDLVEQLQNKIKAYRKQVEETEEIASLNLSKYRKVQQELDDASERADEAENQLAKMRAKNRSSVSQSRGDSQMRETSLAPGRAGSVRR